MSVAGELSTTRNRACTSYILSCPPVSIIRPLNNAINLSYYVAAQPSETLVACTMHNIHTMRYIREALNTLAFPAARVHVATCMISGLNHLPILSCTAQGCQ